MLCSLHSHRELQLNLKTNDTQNCQKMELYGSPTTKDLKKPHSSGQVGEAGMQAKRRSVTERGSGGMGSPTFTCGE